MAMSKGVSMKTCTIDGKLITDRNKLHYIIATSLDFPDWYGENLDALYDCLTDMHEETKIIIENSDLLETNLGVYAHSLYKVLKNASDDNKWVNWEMHHKNIE
jgi:ribonuclease inhibitor